jgi:hypothetical protein
MEKAIAAPSTMILLCSWAAGWIPLIPSRLFFFSKRSLTSRWPVMGFNELNSTPSIRSTRLCGPPHALSVIERVAVADQRPLSIHRGRRWAWTRHQKAPASESGRYSFTKHQSSLQGRRDIWRDGPWGSTMKASEKFAPIPCSGSYRPGSTENDMPGSSMV